MTRAVVRGVGAGLPKATLTNDNLALKVNTSDEWIRRRTGIGQRHVCDEDENTTTLSLQAAREALADGNVQPQDLDLIVCATVTSEFPSPSTASLVQQGLGATSGAAFDVGAACAGFIYATSIVAAMIETGRASTALVIGVDTLTKHVDWTDRNTCVLFGDGAGAMILAASNDSNRGVMQSALFGDARGADLIRVVPPKGQACRHIEMAGAEVFRFAVGAMVDACCEVLARGGLETSDIDLFVPHQANLRIIESATERLNIDMAKVFVNVERYGNTSGGSVPIALRDAVRSGRLVPGMRILTVGFGAGLVWGANVIVW